MDPVPTTTQAKPVSEDAFFADRLRIWSSFTSSASVFVVFVAVVLILLAYFLG